MSDRNKCTKLARTIESSDKKKICMMDASSGTVTIFTCKKKANPENAVIKKCAETGGYMSDTEWMVVKKLKIEN
ncbi:MAG: hypothetical protein KAJ91_02210 [Candidatus Aenigmarchaeota archaeon]|nr:hypothetical protein [Candidatus Aenigmarchaeota archaeon]